MNTSLPKSGPKPALDDLIRRTAPDAGLTEDQARAVITGALGLLDRYAEPEALRRLFDAVDGAEAVARSPEAKPKAGGGLFGGLMSSAGGVSGKAMADGMGLLSRLEKIGVDREMLKTFVKAFRKRVNKTTGSDVLTDAVRTIPGVGPLIGG